MRTLRMLTNRRRTGGGGGGGLVKELAFRKKNKQG